MQTTECKPFLKWQGGKSALMPQIAPYLPKRCDRWIEPFLGGGGAFFWAYNAGIADKFILADSNPKLISTYMAVRDRYPLLEVDLAFHEASHSKEYYYQSRDCYNISPTPDRFIYLNKTGFNGLYRENRLGCFNVPMGQYKKPSICDRPTLLAASEALQSAKLECADFTETIATARAGDFIYCDPPYDNTFTGYTRGGFTQAHQMALRDTLVQAGDRGVKWAISNSDTPFIRELYDGFAIAPISARRSSSAKASGRGIVNELLIYN